jgi:hypothetical protein
MKNKKLILIIIGIIAIAIITVVALLLKKDTTSQEGEIKVPDSLLDSTLEQSDDLQISEMEKTPDLSASAPLYYAEEITNVSQVEEFIDNLGYSYERNKAVTDNYYTWGDENSDAIFGYSTGDNILDVNIRTEIKALTQLNKDNAESVVTSYLNSLGLDYDYHLSKMVASEEYYTIYLNRMLGDYPIETGNQYGYTDYLLFSSDGQLKYAQLLFVKFTNKLNYNVPLIDTDDLLSVINEAEYPKQIRVDDLDFIQSSEAEETTYMEGPYDDTTETVIATVNDCTPTDISLVYYYPKQTGIYILPTYKLSCISTATYEDSEYSVSSIVYTNAVSPEYISSE